MNLKFMEKLGRRKEVLLRYLEKGRKNIIGYFGGV